MKYLLLLVAAFTLNSCNTMIGIYRDGKHAYEWTRAKFQGGGGDYHDEAPIY